MRTTLYILTAFLTVSCAVDWAQSGQAVLIEAVAPVYPLLAVYSSTEGEVSVKLTIDAAAMVSAAKVVQGHRLLAVAAEDAAKQWRFASVGRELQITVGFSFRILPKGTSDTELATRFRTPFHMEVRRVIPEATTNRDPAADPPRHKSK